MANYAGGWNAAKKIKTIEGWDNYGNGTDDYGFSALPGGESDSVSRYRRFSSVGKEGHWWTATEPNDCDDCENAYHWHIYDEGRFYLEESGKHYGYSVRCVMGIARAKTPPKYTLRLYAETGGTVSAAPSKKTYSAGETVTLSAVPKKGYSFSHWTGGLTEDSVSAVTAITMNTNMTIVAVFNDNAPPRGDYGTLYDERDGNIYKTVKIGKQTWMAENLNYKPRIGESRCYNDSNSYCEKYGRLYEWKTAATACPAGWHLPTAIEWDNLFRATGSKLVVNASHTGFYYFDYWDGAGKKLKARSGWKWEKISNVSGNGTDKYGFSALPGGVSYDGVFNYVGERGGWWTAPVRNADKAHTRGMSHNSKDVDVILHDDINKYPTSSVRCVMNDK
jgi:uncharacterized protein (TIGR02145 family)